MLMAEDSEARGDGGRLSPCAESEGRQHPLDQCDAERIALLGAMAGGFAHELNNVLVTILGYSGLGKAMLRAVGGSERVVGYLTEVESAGERAKLLVRQLSTLSRRGLPTDPLAVADAVGDFVAVFGASFPESLTLSAAIDDALPALEIDRSHLHRLLSDLCRNAREASEGPGPVLISARRVRLVLTERCASCHQEFSGDHVRVAVGDQGCGIARDLRKRVFEPFFTTAPAGTRAGMGLAVVHGLAHLYRGHVQIDRARECGTEIAVLLPVARTDSDAAASDAC